MSTQPTYHRYLVDVTCTVEVDAADSPEDAAHQAVEYVESAGPDVRAATSGDFTRAEEVTRP